MAHNIHVANTSMKRKIGNTPLRLFMFIPLQVHSVKKDIVPLILTFYLRFGFYWLLS